jgi:hypothetical protein
MAIWPGLSIFPLVLSFNLLGDAFDPSRKQSLSWQAVNAVQATAAMPLK